MSCLTLLTTFQILRYVSSLGRQERAKDCMTFVRYIVRSFTAEGTEKHSGKYLGWKGQNRGSPIPFFTLSAQRMQLVKPQQLYPVAMCPQTQHHPTPQCKALVKPTYSSCQETTEHLECSDQITPMITVTARSPAPLREGGVGQRHCFSFWPKFKIWISFFF